MRHYNHECEPFKSDIRREANRRRRKQEQFFDSGLGLVFVILAIIIGMFEMVIKGIGNLFF